MLKRAAAPVYLDYAATTPVDPAVATEMQRCLMADGIFANPSSDTHAAGRAAAGVVERARTDIATLVGARSTELVFTSGATESDNLAMLGTARYRKREGRHIVTVKTEHKAVVDSARQLDREGFDITWLTPDSTGRITPDTVVAALRDDTTLVSVMLVNNELGVIQPIAEIGAMCRQREITFHVDAAQAVGKMSVDVAALNVDLLAFTAHKMYGPKGIGALYVAGDFAPRIEPLIFGGGQERGIRPGTLPVHQIAGFGAAVRLAAATLHEESRRLWQLRSVLIEGVRTIEGVIFNGDTDASIPGIVNVSVDGVNGESLLAAMQPIALSSGSACNSASREPSYVLKALGHSDALAESSLRFSFGRFTEMADIETAVEQLVSAVNYLRHHSAGPTAG